MKELDGVGLQTENMGVLLGRHDPLIPLDPLPFVLRTFTLLWLNNVQ
jgi:hypothetical protein